MWEILKHSIYSQEQGEESLQTSCLDTHQLGQLKLKSTQEKSCYQGKLTESYLNSLFGMISTRSESTTPTAQNISKGLNQSEMNLSSQADFLALTSVQQEKEQESKGNTLDSGRKWRGWFAKYDPNSCSWRTAQCSLLGDLEPYSETWPNSGMMQNGKCSELTMLALPIEERESGYWLTPSTIQIMPNENRRVKRTKYRESIGRNDALGCLLEQVVTAKFWPTPDANMGARGTQEEWKPTRPSGQPAQYPINQAIRDTDGKGQLSPDWVCWLMGWPVGWTSLSPITMDWRDWGVDPADNGSIPRVGFNIPNRAKRLKAIGNGQVPLVATTAFLELSEGLL